MDRVDGADVRMVQDCGGSGFLEEAGALILVDGNVCRKKFECDNPAELEVLGLIDNAHAPLSQLFKNLVMRNCLADHCVCLK